MDQTLAAVSALFIAGVLGTACGQAKKAACTDACTSAATQCTGTSLQTCEKQTDGCLGWTATSMCPTGQVCRGASCAPDCAIPCGATACCAMGQGCANGTCCDVPCGDSCCAAHQVCGVDADGKKSCGLPCATSGECQTASPTAPCCAVQPDGTGACLAQQTRAVCKCATISDCLPGSSCAPDTAKQASGPLVCAPVDGTAYAGCNGGQGCVAGFDCWQDALGNDYCAKSCSQPSECRDGCCVTLTSTCSNPGGAPCHGFGACMPCH